MNSITKDNKGITLVALVITLIIIGILFSVMTYTGMKTYRTAQVTKFVTEMQLIQTKVDEYVKDNEIPAGNTLTQSQQEIINNAYAFEEISTNTGFIYFSTEDLKTHFDTLDDIGNNVMINFLTREVVSETGIEYDGKMYYTQYKLPNGQTVQGTDSTIVRIPNPSASINIDGLNATITISNMLSNYSLMYKEQNDNYWTTITNFTETGKMYNVVITKSGLYSFKAIDNTNPEAINTRQIQIRLANKPKTNQELTYNYSSDNIQEWATLNGYIWIPRFAYMEDTEQSEYIIKYIKGNSNIATDDTYVNEDWKVPAIFLKDGEQLTGIWISAQQVYSIEDVITNTSLTGEKEILGN